jgi:hypothetical protein
MGIVIGTDVRRADPVTRSVSHIGGLIIANETVICCSRVLTTESRSYDLALSVAFLAQSPLVGPNAMHLGRTAFAPGQIGTHNTL